MCRALRLRVCPESAGGCRLRGAPEGLTRAGSVSEAGMLALAAGTRPQFSMGPLECPHTVAAGVPRTEGFMETKRNPLPSTAEPWFLRHQPTHGSEGPGVRDTDVILEVLPHCSTCP